MIRYTFLRLKSLTRQINRLKSNFTGYGTGNAKKIWKIEKLGIILQQRKI